MKHIGWCIERIIDCMQKFPKDVIEEKDKNIAKEILDSMEGYAKTIDKIFSAKDFRKNIERLASSEFESFKLQAKQIEKLHKDIENSLYHIELYIKELREIIEHRPEGWRRSYDQLVVYFYQTFGDERGDLRKEFNVALHNEDELNKLKIAEKHLKEMLE